MGIAAARRHFEMLKSDYENTPFSLGDFELNSRLGEVRERIAKLQKGFDQLGDNESVAIADRLALDLKEFSALASALANAIGRKIKQDDDCPSTH